ncbi:membrane protein [Alcaligenes pakistanensis]|uniref:Membrane protein n=1 Tax=Alcaligenes pakistanensis TaxID=1482717 RepID=A0A8H9M5A1_9BURK|nr:twin transmembrane helix small protein [Alcaligenes pakistanensis]MBP6623306.1 twin transmembrane helix small protein [Alcaligenes sp.]GHC51400.1 membrane protein [Alcaligenes pakistanensis]HCA18003.1 twin transmembrane helix small protein [Alcaligenes faecalis]
MRVLVLIVFLGVIVSLGSALVYLMRDRGNSNRMAYALTWRVGLSVALFLFVLLAHYLGWIESTGVPLA